MDRITMGFGPISDVTGFSHRDGRTYLQILEALRRKVNELVAAYTNIGSRFTTLQTDWTQAFDAFQDRVSVPVDEYQDLVGALNVKLAEITPFTTTDTDYTNL